MTTLSGTTLSFWRRRAAADGRRIHRGLLAALGALGLFVSTLTEQPIGATIAIGW